jgi:hypothetical protein
MKKNQNSKIRNPNLLVVVLIFAFFYLLSVSLIYADSLTNSPGTMADDATVGTKTWSNANNAKASDNSYATFSGAGVRSTSHYLKATNFGFSIPSEATINGISVEIERKETLNDFGVQDVAISIVKSDGTIGTTNKSTGAEWPYPSDAYTSFGSSSDLWGETWSPANINDSDFGVVLSASDKDDFPVVDHIRITVYYTQSGGEQIESTSYRIKNYGFGAGGSEGLNSSNYSLFGTAGEIDALGLFSTNYTFGGGLIYTLQASVSAAPAFTNSGSNYDRLKFTLDSAVGPADTEYAIGISTDNFVTDTTHYIQSDNTIGTTMTWQTYPQWGGSSGAYVTGLLNNTTYYIQVKSRQGNFTEGPWSVASSATTSDPSLTFSLDSSTINFSNLNSGNTYTDSAKTSVLTTSTNAYNGYVIYAKESQALTSSVGTIPDFSGSNSSPTTWSGTGFGYNTSDTNLTTGSGGASRFSGNKYAAFAISSSTNGDPVADNLGPVQSSPISSEQFTISYRVSGNSTTKAGTYTNTIQYTIVPTY